MDRDEFVPRDNKFIQVINLFNKFINKFI
jgi:hypothetical protein